MSVCDLIPFIRVFFLRLYSFLFGLSCVDTDMSLSNKLKLKFITGTRGSGGDTSFG